MVLGLLACALDIVRLVVMLRAERALDLTWNQVDGAVWTEVQASIAFFVVAFINIQPLITAGAISCFPTRDNARVSSSVAMQSMKNASKRESSEQVRRGKTEGSAAQ